MTSLHNRHIKPLILAGLDGSNWHAKDYVKRGGYESLRPILTEAITPEPVRAGLKAAPPPGRGGADGRRLGIPGRRASRLNPSLPPTSLFAAPTMKSIF